MRGAIYGNFGLADLRRRLFLIWILAIRISATCNFVVVVHAARPQDMNQSHRNIFTSLNIPNRSNIAKIERRFAKRVNIVREKIDTELESIAGFFRASGGAMFISQTKFDSCSI